jgi:hypothetical protein
MRDDIISEKLGGGRTSNIEILKIIAIVMVVMCHMVPNGGNVNALSYVDLRHASANIQLVALVMNNYLGSIGNAIFLVCSAWFLVDSYKIKMKKLVDILIDNWVVSVLFCAAFIIFGVNISTRELVWQFLPTTSGENWFITCYLLFYVSHPFLNQIINHVTQNTLKSINICLLSIYGVGQVLFPGSYYYTPLIGFCTIYFIVAYSKKYLMDIIVDRKKNIQILMMSSASLMALIVLTDLIGLKINALSGQMQRWNLLTNPLVILIAISMFNLFVNSLKKFQNNQINFVASTSMLVYIIHNNYIIKTYIRQKYFEMIFEVFTYKYIYLWACIGAIVTFLLSVTIASLYIAGKNIIKTFITKL